MPSAGAGQGPAPAEGFGADLGHFRGANRAPGKAQRSGFSGERRRSGMSEFSPILVKIRDMELAPTTSGIKSWGHRPSFHLAQLPAVRVGSGVFVGVANGVKRREKRNSCGLYPAAHTPTRKKQGSTLGKVDRPDHVEAQTTDGMYAYQNLSRLYKEKGVPPTDNNLITLFFPSGYLQDLLILCVAAKEATHHERLHESPAPAVLSGAGLQ